MGFFSFTQEIAMDLGTANTIITSDGKIVVDEPSVVALDRRTDRMIAVGERAKMMYEKTHDNIRTVGNIARHHRQQFRKTGCCKAEKYRFQTYRTRTRSGGTGLGVWHQIQRQRAEIG